MFKVDADGLLTLNTSKKLGLDEAHATLYAASLMSFTVTGVFVPGITAKFVETPELKSVKTKAKTSLKPH